MDERHRLVFETHEEGKLTFEEYLGWVVFYEKRSFTRNQFRDFIFAQSKPYPRMIELIAQLKRLHGLKIVVVSNESREVNAPVSVSSSWTNWQTRSFLPVSFASASRMWRSFVWRSTSPRRRPSKSPLS